MKSPYEKYAFIAAVLYVIIASAGIWVYFSSFSNYERVECSVISESCEVYCEFYNVHSPIQCTDLLPPMMVNGRYPCYYNSDDNSLLFERRSEVPVRAISIGFTFISSIVLLPGCLILWFGYDIPLKCTV